jgi:uncharacterized protein YkwD
MIATSAEAAPRHPSRAFALGVPLVSALFLIAVPTPAAHADPLDNLRGAVNGARAQSTCPALAYSGQLEAAAQDWVRTAEALGSVNAPRLDLSKGGYKGQASGNIASGDPTADATNTMIGGASGDIKDCSFKDFGVGMVRDEVIEASYVAVVLGQPKAPAAEPAKPAAPAQANTAIVTGGDADVFNIAHNDVPDPANGITGMKIATLPNGTQVDLDGACKAGWCRVNSQQIPQGFGFVEQGHLAFG